MVHDEDSDVVVEVADVSFRYGRHEALRSVSLTLGPGIHGLLGPNGAGKTTLMALLATQRRLQSGSISIAGHNLAARGGREAVRPLLGFLPQSYPMIGSMRVLDYVMYGAWCCGVDEKAAREAAELALEQAGVRELSDRRVRQLSGGQRQRVGIAGAIAHHPRLLILDEPTAGLDPTVRIEFRALLASIAQEATVLLSTHLIEDVAHLCREIFVLDRGVILFKGSPAELATAPPLNGTPTTDDELTSPLERGYSHVLTGRSL